MLIQGVMRTTTMKSRMRNLLTPCLKIKTIYLIQLIFQIPLLSTTTQLEITLTALLKWKIMKKKMMALTPVIAKMTTIAPRE